MDDLISRQAAKQAVDRIFLGETSVLRMRFRLLDYFDKMPSAQVEQKKGKWLAKWSGDGEVLLEEICSECGIVIEDNIPTGFNFCPNCGADMR